MEVRFWGTRGSIAKAGPSTVRYGGNTSCVEVRSGAGTLLILDCGTGAHGLGQALMAGATALRGHLLLTHTHWDHIQGFPFFAPLFAPGNGWDVYGPRGLGESLRETLAGQMQYLYFPVALEQLGATVRYHDLVEGAFAIADVRVSARYLNHPALTLGYRLEADGVTLVYATDHEPHARELAEARPGVEITGEDRRHVDFLAGADLVIHDAQYTSGEYPAKVGWGHSTIEYVVEVARAAGVRRLALYHHDPLRDDDGLDRVTELARRQVAAGGALPEVFAAAEGQVFAFPRRPGAGGRRSSSDLPVPPTPSPALLERPVLIAASDPALVAHLSAAVDADNLRLLVTANAAEALAVVRDCRPALLLVERRLPDRDGFDLCRALRAGADQFSTELPVVVVTSEDDPADQRAGVKLGVTDWLVAPFSALYARTRIRAWLLRRACRWIPASRPADEADRLRALHDLGLLGTPPEERFDRLTRLAQRLFDVPIALVSFVDEHRQWFKSRLGLEVAETPREVSFCAHAIHGTGAFVVPDALLDHRFADNPCVTEPPRVRFYAGWPVRAVDGRPVGTLCIVDRRPRELGAADLQALRDLAALVEGELARTPATLPSGPAP
jgi:phosphoribosyl 1,2-cyclic phosphodiesterase/DNA-binding response OmpR family regulator